MNIMGIHNLNHVRDFLSPHEFVIKLLICSLSYFIVFTESKAVLNPGSQVVSDVLCVPRWMIMCVCGVHGE